jgi:hypothetical protein
LKIFEYKETGSVFNEFQKRNKDILSDKGNLLKKLIFSDPAICGSSIIILPSKDYILCKSDSHFETLDYSKEKIEVFLLTGKKIN